jgi:hypothetical protein
MRHYKFIKLKAAFLLTVFALNTVVAFACSLGLNMGYNQKHHEKKEEKPASTHSHSHAPATKSHHHNTVTTHRHEGVEKHVHTGTTSHSHDKAPASHNHEESKSEQDDCCTKNAVKFQAEDKKLEHSANIAIKAPVFLAFLSAFLGFGPAPNTTIDRTKYVVPQFYPPPDIRIAIQSFLI